MPFRVHRDLLKGPGLVYNAARAYEDRELFASADNLCSPVYLEAGPDGAIYVVDMYRQIIENADADEGRGVPNVPPEILQKYGLRGGSTMGRIYRVAPKGTPRGSKPQLSRARPGELAAALGSIDAKVVVDTLGGLLHPRNPEPLQLAALGALNEQSSPEVIRVLADAWGSLTQGPRVKAAEIALGRKERLGPLLEAVRAGKIPADAFDPAQRARLLGSTDKAIAEAAKTVFGAASRTLDPKLFEKHKAALDLNGDAARGASAFKKQCITCHKAGGEGAEVGPNLASVRNRPREQILRDILYPSMAFTPQYHQYVVATTDGRLITGLITSTNATGYTIRRQGGEEVSLLRKDVEELSDTQISLMPENLLEGLGPREVADLLEYVKQAG